MNQKDQMLSEIVNSVGIAYQLLVTRFGQVVSEDLIPFPQFVMLSHFMKDPKRQRTISTIASAFQAPQPGITKTIQKLVQHKLVEEQSNPDDGRSKILYITKKGINTFSTALSKLAPDMRQVFSTMSEEELKVMHSCLLKLRNWLDSNRDNVLSTKI